MNKANMINSIKVSTLCCRGLDCQNYECQYLHPQWLEVIDTCLYCLKDFCEKKKHNLGYGETWDQIRESTKGYDESWKDYFTGEHCDFFYSDAERAAIFAEKQAKKEEKEWRKNYVLGEEVV